MAEDLIKRLELLEYHQRLLLELVEYPAKAFTKVIIQKNMDEREVDEFHKMCEGLSKKLEEQRAEGFLYFHPLLIEFTERLNKKLDVKETIKACLDSNIHVELMIELEKYLSD